MKTFLQYIAEASHDMTGTLVRRHKVGGRERNKNRVFPSWEDEHKETLKSMWNDPETPIHDIASKLGRSYSSVVSKAASMNLKPRNPTASVRIKK